MSKSGAIIHKKKLDFLDFFNDIIKKGGGGVVVVITGRASQTICYSISRGK